MWVIIRGYISDGFPVNGPLNQFWETSVGDVSISRLYRALSLGLPDQEVRQGKWFLGVGSLRDQPPAPISKWVAIHNFDMEQQIWYMDAYGTAK